MPATITYADYTFSAEGAPLYSQRRDYETDAPDGVPNRATVTLTVTQLFTEPSFAFASLLVLAAPLAGAAETLPLLETVAAVRALRLEEAARHYPVKLRGIVTFYSAADGHAFLQDETGGVFFRPGMLAQPGRVELAAGERVEISGVSVKGNFSPSVAGGPGSA